MRSPSKLIVRGRLIAQRVVNLDVTVPADHPGAHSANYFVGSLHSVAWAIALMLLGTPRP